MYSSSSFSPFGLQRTNWKFVVVDKPAIKEQVAMAANDMGMNKFVLQAPVIIAVVLERANFTSAIGSTIKQKDYTMIDIGIAVENICLQATELGLGSCIVGWFNEHKVKKILQIPRKRVPYSSLGYSDDMQRTKIRKKIEEIYSFNKYV